AQALIAPDRRPRTSVRAAVERSGSKRKQTTADFFQGDAGPEKMADTSGENQAEGGMGSGEKKASGAEINSVPEKTLFTVGQNGREAAAQENASHGILSKGDTKKLPQYLYEPPYIYTVHVNSFKRKEAALERRRELRSRGFEAWVAWVDLDEKGIWYRVLLGTYDDKGTALAQTQRLKQSREFRDARQIAANATLLTESAGVPR
ncbi:MAG: SPOR domain-containing protein, partial [Syntrophobacteria bacterium]